jgi:hypothetical protein
MSDTAIFAIIQFEIEYCASLIATLRDILMLPGDEGLKRLVEITKPQSPNAAASADARKKKKRRAASRKKRKWLTSLLTQVDDTPLSFTSSFNFQSFEEEMDKRW